MEPAGFENKNTYQFNVKSSHNQTPTQYCTVATHQLMIGLEVERNHLNIY